MDIYIFSVYMTYDAYIYNIVSYHIISYHIIRVYKHINPIIISSG